MDNLGSDPSSAEGGARHRLRHLPAPRAGESPRGPPECPAGCQGSGSRFTHWLKYSSNGSREGGAAEWTSSPTPGHTAPQGHTDGDPRSADRDRTHRTPRVPRAALGSPSIRRGLWSRVVPRHAPLTVYCTEVGARFLFSPQPHRGGPLRGEVPTGPGTPLRSEWRPASPGLPCPGHQLPAPRGCRDANAGLGTGPCWSSPQYRLGHCFLEAPLPPAGAFLGVSLSSFTFFSRAFPLLGAEKVRETLLNSRGKTPTSPSKRFLDTCR